MKEIPSNFLADLLKPQPDGSLIWLIDVSLNESETLYVCTGNQDITQGGNDYEHFPIVLPEPRERGDGSPTDVSITVADPGMVTTAMLEQNDGLRGREITLKIYNTDAAEVMSEAVFTVKGSESQPGRSIVFQAGNENIFNVWVPGGTHVRDFCPLVYKGTRCGYTADLETCDHELFGADGCAFHDNTDRYGGEPGLPANN